MTFFHWDATFQTGSGVVDAQHRQLINIINEFGGLLAREVPGKNDIERVCSALMDYTNHHFKEEEQLMSSTGLDQRHVAQHLQQHNGLLDEIKPLSQLVVVGDFAAGEYMFEFLVNWLVFHILGTDMLMARQIEAIHQGRTAEEAYLTEEKHNKNATGQLLIAIKKLLHQVSSRNKQLAEMNATLERRVQERTRDLSEANEKLKALANTDGLTGVLNHRAFMEEAASMVGLAKRYQRPLSLLLIDLDHFKRVNDNYGHQVGDLVLIKLSQAMTKCLRGTDILGRIGGEEFAIILPETGLDQTAELTERLLDTVRNTTIKVDSTTMLNVTASIGVATVPPLACDLDAVIKEADEALYKAKAEGRDRSCGAFGPNT